MNSGRTVFAQLFDFLPKHEFNQCIRRYCGHRRLRKFSCLDQFLCILPQSNLENRFVRVSLT